MIKKTSEEYEGPVHPEAQRLFEIVLECMKFWDAGTPVRPGAEIVKDARSALKEACGQ